MIRPAILMLVIMTLSVISYGQASFQKLYYSSYLFASGYKVLPTPESGYLIISGNGIIKTNAAGDTIWTRWYYPDGNPLDATTSADGHFEILTYDGYYLNNHIQLIKLDQQGDTAWTKSYTDSTSVLYPVSLTSCSDGGYLIQLNRLVYLVGFRNSILIKTDAYGNIQWTTAFDQLQGSALIETEDGFLATGTFYPGDTTTFYNDACVFKMDQNGAVLWSKRFNAFQGDHPLKFLQASDHSIYIAGVVDSAYGLSQEDHIFLMKLNESGNLQWAKLFNPESDIFDPAPAPVALRELDDQSLVLGLNRMGVINFDSLGNFLSVKSYATDHYFILGDLIPSADHGLILLASGPLLIKTDSGGNASCQMENLGWSDIPVVFTEQTNIILNLSVQINPVFSPVHDNGSFPEQTMEYCGYTGIAETSAAPSEIEIFPNPATSYVTIKVAHQAIVCIYDLSGRKYLTLNEGKLTMAQNVDVSSLPSGLYFIAAEINNIKTIRKLEIIR